MLTFELSSKITISINNKYKGFIKKIQRKKQIKITKIKRQQFSNFERKSKFGNLENNRNLNFKIYLEIIYLQHKI